MIPDIDLLEVRVICSNGRNIYQSTVLMLVSTSIILVRVIVLFQRKLHNSFINNWLVNAYSWTMIKLTNTAIIIVRMIVFYKGRLIIVSSRTCLFLSWYSFETSHFVLDIDRCTVWYNCMLS